jgi:hypothetical protein
MAQIISQMVRCVGNGYAATAGIERLQQRFNAGIIAQLVGVTAAGRQYKQTIRSGIKRIIGQLTVSFQADSLPTVHQRLYKLTLLIDNPSCLNLCRKRITSNSSNPSEIKM